jgi:hypothetical protein
MNRSAAALAVLLRRVIMYSTLPISGCPSGGGVPKVFCPANFSLGGNPCWISS